MWMKRILLLLLVTAVVMQTRAAEEEENQNEDGASDDDVDDDGEDVPEHKNLTTTATAVLEQTESTSISSEGTTTIPLPPEEAYFVRGDDNKICVAVKLEVKLEFIIPSDEDSEKTKNINPNRENYSASGDCGEDNLKPRLTIEGNEDINITFAFEKTDDGESWTMSSMKLQFNPANFFDKEDEPSLQTLTPQDLPSFSAPMGQSFSCSESTKVFLYKDETTLAAYVVIDSIKLQAFDVPADFGPEHMCSIGEATPSKRIEHRSDTAPIAVGLTMAILTLFAVTGFAVHRIMHQKKVDYSNM